MKCTLSKYGKIRKDIVNWTTHDGHADARFTSMFDLYGLPGDFPGFSAGASVPDARARATVLEGAFAIDINDWRFVPYIQVHEFEALIFADASKLAAAYPGHGNGVNGLVAIANVTSPELINDNDPPSKRIKAQIPAYNKTAAASQVTSAIGIQVLRGRCPHFESWLTKLENL